MTTAAFHAVLLLVLLANPTAAQIGGVPASQRPPCGEAPDGQYGYTRDRAIQVGGSPMYGAARQRRYLDMLRGPEGQRVTYKRTGQDRDADGTILDAYEVTYEGLEKPVTLFLDWYHYAAPRLPRGFSCIGPIDIGLPPVDPFQETGQLRALAVVQATTANLSPIPAGIEGQPPSAAIYDEFRLLALAARAAAAKGTPVGRENAPADLKGIGMVVLIYPYPCEGRTLPVGGVGIHGQNGALVPRAQRQALPSDELSRVLPGVAIPDGAKAYAYQLTRPRPNDTVVASYLEDGCDVRGNILRLPIRATPPRSIDAPSPKLPSGAKGPATVFLQAVVNFEGQFQEPVYIGGPSELVSAAREAVSTWRAEPARINGAPLATGVLVQVRFGPF